MEFDHLSEALIFMQTRGLIIAAELDEKSIPLTHLHEKIQAFTLGSELYVIVGNEVTGVESETLSKAHIISHIPMLGMKESLNVGQAAAIIMWELQSL